MRSRSRGDLWVLGEHRLLCGDATVFADVERVLDGQLADMTFTDPPYNVDYGSSAKDKLRGNKRKILNDDLGSGFEAFLHDACANILAVTKGAVYVCMSSSELHTLQRAFTAAGGKWSTFVIWAKHTFTLGRADYQRQYEPILYGWRDGHDHYWCGARDQGDVWFVDKPARNDLHPTMKPVALVERAIRNSSKSRDIVLDPFGGSGSTLIACREGRAPGAAGRARSEVLRRDRAALAGVDGRAGDARSRRANVRRDRRRACSRGGVTVEMSVGQRAVLEEPGGAARGHAAEQLVDFDPEQLARTVPCRRPADRDASRRAWTRTRRRG